MASEKTNGLHCLYCEKPLVRNQTKYCSNAHRVAYYRANRRTGERETVPEEKPVQTEQNSALTVVRRDLARAEGMVVELRTQRDKLTTERDLALGRVSELERQTGQLEGKIEALTEQIMDSAEPVSRPLWERVVIVAAVIALLVLVVVAVVQLT